MGEEAQGKGQKGPRKQLARGIFLKTPLLWTCAAVLTAVIQRSLNDSRWLGAGIAVCQPTSPYPSLTTVIDKRHKSYINSQCVGLLACMNYNQQGRK